MKNLLWAKASSWGKHMCLDQQTHWRAGVKSNHNCASSINSKRRIVLCETLQSVASTSSVAQNNAVVTAYVCATKCHRLLHKSNCMLTSTKHSFCRAMKSVSSPPRNTTDSNRAVNRISFVKFRVKSMIGGESLTVCGGGLEKSVNHKERRH